MELMQKYAKDDGAIGIENLNRWPANSTAVKFLSMTTSAESVEELQQVKAHRYLSYWQLSFCLQHALFKRPWRKEDLELLEELASFSVRRAYRYVD